MICRSENKRQLADSLAVYRMRDAGCGMQDAGCRIQDTGCGMQDTGCGMQDTGCESLCYLVTLLPCYFVTLLLCYHVTLFPCHPYSTFLLKKYLLIKIPCPLLSEGLWVPVITLSNSQPCATRSLIFFVITMLFPEMFPKLIPTIL